MDFLDEHVPILKDPTFSKILNAFLIVYLNNIYHKNNDTHLMEKYEHRLEEKTNTLMMTKTQKERDLGYVKQKIQDL